MSHPLPRARRARRALVLALAGLAAVAPLAAPAEVHPFYEQRLAAGVLALSRGDAAAAAEELRLAAFGLLDEPARLVEALAHLSLAEQALARQAGGDETALTATLERLLAVEGSFPVWSAAELPAATRTAVEGLLAERVPEPGLTAVPAFAGIARRRAAERIAALPPAERRRELLARSAAEPDVARWQVMLGELELAAGDASAAVTRAQRALAAQPTDVEQVAARCLRGAALARAGSCAAAVADLEICPATRQEPEAAQALLQCHAQLGQWRQAKEFADALPASLKGRRELSRLVRQVEREAARLPAAPPAAGAAPTDRAASPPAATPAAPPEGNGSAAPDSAAPAPAVPAVLPAADRQRLDRARALMGEARRAGDLGEAFELARAVADAHPGSIEAQHLAGEIAYRASRWDAAVTYFRRGGEPPAEPALQFYLAVALWESGDGDEAARVLERALPDLPRSAFVDGYVERILGRPR